MRDRLFLISGILGVMALAMTLLLNGVGPRQTGPLPPGFLTPIIAFEFAESEAEVYRLFQPDGSAAAMDRLNRWDFLFMAVYSLFLFTFALAAARGAGRPALYAAAALAPLILAADALENVQLLGLTMRMQLEGGSLAATLDRLHVYTWLKWGGLAAYFVLIASYFRERPGVWRGIWLAAQLPALLAVLAFLRRGLPSELLALSVGVMFLLMTVFALKVSFKE